ncbi:hypothetical protein AMS68_000568 [Peltaster fructicola]|uniref:Alpha/beta hydrolase fold-3 domain-containing protein n=1 Tax=Peltaster fructicola TaxID=286661 RepID=A0A6H0XK84_9PEZI|nr:hypothetical protein AMS68_000568 [Peltaster fructicola]
MEDATRLIKLLVPQIPSLASTALWHTLGRTPNSDKWDLRTEMTVQVLRYFMSGAGQATPSPVSRVQRMSLKPQPVKGKVWAAQAMLKAPTAGEETVREAVFKAIEDMASSPVNYTKPDLVDLEVEWTGFRPEARNDEPAPAISEEEKYKRMMAEPTRTSETTILYVHGGAYYLCGLDTHRPLCSRLAKESAGRVCSVKYRLAPQAAFPSQLLDAFTAYLSLLYPPPGSMHEPVPAKHIVVSGDSAGGNLAFALLQLLLQLHRTSATPTVRFFGKDVEVPLPAGFAANSGWFDITRSMPSITDNHKTDYLPLPNHDDAVSRFPKDDIWPTTPPRGDLFCDLSLIDHPLVSVVGAESWEKSPPLWFNTGGEMLTDEDKLVVSRTAQQGVTVHYEEYEAMPHCFPMLIPHLEESTKCIKSWGSFCRRAVEEPASLKTNGTFFHAKTGKQYAVDPKTVSKIDIHEARKLMAEAKEQRLKGYDHEGKGMPKPSL